MSPAGTFSPVKVTWPGLEPIITGFPFKVSLLIREVVLPPVAPLTGAVVSVTASNGFKHGGFEITIGPAIVFVELQPSKLVKILV